MSAKKVVLSKERYHEILRFAQEFAPDLFKSERPLPPLAIGTAKLMTERKFREKYDVKSREMNSFFYRYTNSTHYLHQVAKMWVRVDIDGNKSDKVTKEESQAAIQQLKERGINFTFRKKKKPQPKKAPDLSVLASKFKTG